MTVHLYQTSRGGESRIAMPITNGQPYRCYSIYRLTIPDLRIGDLVQITAQFEITIKYKIMLAHFLSRGPDGAPDLSSGWMFISPAWPAGENGLLEQHHLFRHVSGAFIADRDGDERVSLFAYGQASAKLWKPADMVVVEQGYGGLSAIVHQGALA